MGISTKTRLVTCWIATKPCHWLIKQWSTPDKGLTPHTPRRRLSRLLFLCLGSFFRVNGSLPVWGIGQQRRPLGWGIRIGSGSAMVNTSRGASHTTPESNETIFCNRCRCCNRHFNTCNQSCPGWAILQP